MSKSENLLPSYEESINTKLSYGSTDPTPRGQQLLDRLTLVRAEHVRSVVNEHIWPALERQAVRGIAKSTVALMPADIVGSAQEENPFSSEKDLGAKLPSIEIMGFAADEHVQQVQLDSHIDTLEFWRQTEVVAELRRVLQDRLATSPAHAHVFDVPNPEPAIAEPVRQQKRGFFGRKSSSATPSSAATPITPTMDDRMMVEVKLEEICLRTMSEFGLYETINRQAIVIRAEVK